MDITDKQIANAKYLQDIYNMKIQRRIGMNLRRIRNEKGLTMDEVHFLTHIPYSSLSKIENLHVTQNPKKTSVALCERLAYAFGMDTVELANELLKPFPGEDMEIPPEKYVSITESDFPANLLMAVFGEKKIDKNKINKGITDMVLNGLPYKEKQYIIQRFREGKSYADIGRSERVTREWVRHVAQRGMDRISEHGLDSFLRS